MGNNTSTSKFGEDEKIWLKIDENSVSSFDMLGILYKPIFFELTPALSNIVIQLQNCDEAFFKNDWIIYDNRHLLANETHLFCECLHRILINKLHQDTQKQSEYLVKTLADKIFNYAQYDNVPLMKTNELLEFTYIKIKYTGDPDGIVEDINKQILCIIREDKHNNSSTYEKGNVQLVSNLVLAYIYNFKFFDIIPENSKKIIGIKFISDYVEFMTIDISTNYIIQIINGNVLTEHINMNIYKSGSLAIHNDRKKIFEYLEIIRQYFIID